MNEIETLVKKLSNGIETKYINDLKVMKDFNSAFGSEEKKEVIEQYFDEITRMLLELKLANVNSAFWYGMTTNNLNFYLKRTVEILNITWETAKKLKEELLK